MVTKIKCRYCKKTFTESEVHIKKNGQASNACLYCWNRYYFSKRGDLHVCGNCCIKCENGF